MLMRRATEAMEDALTRVVETLAMKRNIAAMVLCMENATSQQMKKYWRGEGQGEVTAAEP